MRHRTKHRQLPTEHPYRYRSKQPARPSGAATSAAGRAARTPDGKPSARIAAAWTTIQVDGEGRIR